MDHQTCSVADSDKRKKPHRERRRVVWIDCQKSQIEVMQYPDVTTTTRRHDMLACLGRPEQPNQNPNPKIPHPQESDTNSSVCPRTPHLPQPLPPALPSHQTHTRPLPSPPKKSIHPSLTITQSQQSTAQQNIDLLASTYQRNRAYVPSHRP